MRQRLPVLAMRAGFDMGAAIESYRRDLRAALAAAVLCDERLLQLGGWLLRDVTCDGSVMAETAEICRCDGVMDRIACVFLLVVFDGDAQALALAQAVILPRLRGRGTALAVEGADAHAAVEV